MSKVNAEVVVAALRQIGSGLDAGPRSGPLAAVTVRTAINGIKSLIEQIEQQSESTDRVRQECKHGYEHYCLLCAEERTHESTDPYADCVCGHGRHAHAGYTGACGLCECAAVREPSDL